MQTLNEQNVLEIENLNYEIATNLVIENFNLSLKKGQILTLFGASGCGKSTLLKLVANLLEPKSGAIRTSDFAFIFQEHRLFENLSALENVALMFEGVKNLELKANLPNFNARIKRGEISFKTWREQWILKEFSELGLNVKDARKYPSELSGGMRARVAFVRSLARSLSKECALFLLDEPFSGLDFNVKQILIKKLIMSVKNQQKAALLVTHDSFEAVLLSDEIYFLEPKFMKIEKKLSLKKDFKARDLAFVNEVLQKEFQNRVYLD